MKTQCASAPSSHRPNRSSLTLIAASVALVALIGIPLFSSSLASSASKTSQTLSIQRLVANQSAVNSNIFGSFLKVGKQPAVLPFSPVVAETIDIFAADCTTPKTNFILGDTVCAKTDGVTESDRFVNWCVACPTIDYGGAGVTDIDPNNQPQNFLYTPTTAGLWKATIADPSDSSIIPATFTVTAQADPIATYAGNCTTPKTTFNLGDVVCARAVGFDPAFNRRFAWQDPAGFVRDYTPIMSNPQTDFFTLPATETSVIDVFTVDNRGQWKVNVVSSRGSTLASAPFNVQGATPRADLSIGKGIIGGEPDTGTNFKYSVSVTNFGPNDAANVVVSDDQPDNATFVSPVVQTSGPSFVCNGSDPVVCTRAAGLAVGESATFELTYTAGAAGATITNVATISSDTTELNAADNTASSGRVTIGGTPTNPPTCSLDCPNDITTARTEAGGTHVTFASPETVGSCGTLNYDRASGSLFPVGTTTVHVTSSTGDGACTFNVTVIDSPNPTISCPANQTVAAPSGQSEASVNVGTPTASANTTITGERSDERAVNDLYPIGTTYITWTATDQFDRQANCTQTIIVTSTDAPTITCPSNKTFTAASGECTYTADAGQIGSPTTTGPNVTVTNERSDGEALTAPYPAGQTYITWTATNSVGTASCTQTITVSATDNTPPTLHVPANVSVTTDSCTALLDDELGVATAEDNCTASVNITRTGVPRVGCPAPGDPGRTCESFIFPTGTTYVTYTATDAAGNTSTGVQTVTVTESPAIPPSIDAPANVTLYTGAGATSCSVTVSNLDTTLGTATASDNCPGVSVARSNVPAGNVFPLGNTTITYTATDKSGNTANDQQVVTVVDNTPPVISCPADITQNTDPGLCSAVVNPGTATATDNCDSSPTINGTRSDNQPLNAPYPKGTTTITWTATDHATPTPNQSSCTQTITVEDHEVPVITTNGLTPILWPANHAYHTFNVTDFVLAVSDNCDALTVGNVVIQKVTSDEGENVGGSGNTLNDIVIASDCKSVQVRAERANAADGRVYTITFKVTDSSGNVGTKTSTIHVPKNLGIPVVDSGPHYTVTGNCP